MSQALPVPCLHRIHQGTPTGSCRIQRSLGMSIERDAVAARLSQLNREAADLSLSERSVLVTFDDGWAEPGDLAPQFAIWRHLQPVLFLTSSQTTGDRSLLPVPRLYEWCADTGTSLAELTAAGLTRARLKELPEAEQHDWLDRLGVPRIRASPEVFALDAIRDLMARGWLVGSHGHDHHDLRFELPDKLLGGLRDALEAVRSLGGEPWLAWPEGRCTLETCEIARRAGFERQFSLRVEAGLIARDDLVHREIWR